MTPRNDGKSYAALLFDMDGTLLSSLAAAERVWTAWALRHGVDIGRLLPSMHGKRAADTIRAQNLAGIDLDAEVQWIKKGELDDIDGIVAISGILDLIATLPSDRWAIVTSASLDLATRRLAAAGITPPPVLVTADDVEKGKPEPDGFLLAASRLGVDPADCLVFEDAPAGILAGERAGADVMVITATHQHGFDGPHPTLADYRHIDVRLEGDRLVVRKTL